MVITFTFMRNVSLNETSNLGPLWNKKAFESMRGDTQCASIPIAEYKHTNTHAVGLTMSIDSHTLPSSYSLSSFFYCPLDPVNVPRDFIKIIHGDGILQISD